VRGILDRLAEREMELSPKQRIVIEFLRENLVASASLTVEQLAEKLNVNPSTVVRTAKALGYEGYGELKRDLRYSYLHTLSPLDLLSDHQSQLQDVHPVFAQLRADFQNLNDLISDFDVEAVEELACRIGAARRTLIVSGGTYAALGHVLAQQGRFIGYEIELETGGGSYLAHRLSQLTKNDLLLGIAFWRGPREVVEAMEWADQQALETAAITDNRYGRLGRAARLVLTAPSESTSYYQSITAGMALIYALVNALYLVNPAKSELSAKRAQQLYLDFKTTSEVL
jgi:DNA-binding MurR/RpiR family transcriptional regulator